MSKLGEQVHRLRLRGVNAYLVDDDGELTLVDAGTPWDSGELRAGIIDAGYTVPDIDRVLLTHYDIDHVGSLSSLGLRDSVPIHLAEPDASYLSGRAKPPFSSRKGFLQRVGTRLIDTPRQPIETVEDGDQIGPFIAYRTPGHTLGHTAFVHEPFSVAFVGDLVREKRGQLVALPWVMAADAEMNDRSIREFVSKCPPIEVIAMGHGNPVEEYGYGELQELAEKV
ncbi:MBL fold metallo-hydrolase [Haloferax namakaokahaiae]|uniref:MBL fold metallo-hydrolase n=1 Tax=Haloferax namakaokahaiae TaxID=1748331 RepID=A0ABD5ZFN9_9EURY